VLDKKSKLNNYTGVNKLGAPCHAIVGCLKIIFAWNLTNTSETDLYVCGA
jgi:hypothetical protein